EPRIRQRIDPRIELRVGRLVDLDSDLPQGPSLVAAHRLEVLDDELFVRDDGEHARERPRPLHRLDEKNLGNLHVSTTTPRTVDPASRNGRRRRPSAEPDSLAAGGDTERARMS